MKASKIEIHQVEQEQGVFTEILVDGHRLEGVRSFELKQEVGNSMPTLSIDLNALNSVSYTHLDVYKRQVQQWQCFRRCWA